MTDEEHLGVIALAVEEMKGRCTVVAGVGSNDTRHAVHLTERATELGADALLSVNPYYNRPNRRGIVRHYEEVNRATEPPDPPLQHPAAHGLGPAQRPARRARPARQHLRRQAGQPGQSGEGRRAADLRRQRRPAGRRARPRRARRGARRQPPVRQRDAPDGRRARAPARDRRQPPGRLPRPGDRADGHHGQGCAQPARDPRRGAAAALRGARRAGDGDRLRACSSATACSQPRGLDDPAAGPAARRPGRDRQEHDGRRVRRPDRRRRHRAAVPDRRDARDRPGAPGLRLPARARRGHRGDRDHPRPRGSPRRAAVGAAGARALAAGLRRAADDRDGALQARRAPSARRPAGGHQPRRAAHARPVRDRARAHDPLDSRLVCGGARPPSSGRCC